jgi:hypothetical protein
MRHECKTKEGAYEVWSGVSNPTGKGVFIVYWQGIEIGRDAYMHRAHSIIDKHKQLLITAPRPKRKDLLVTPDTDAWLDGLL